MNKEGFKRQMKNLWRPKANVLIFELANNRFAFGFNSNQERSMVLKNGLLLYNKQVLLVLEKANDVSKPLVVPLKFQEFWIQIKGLLFCYMTRHMGMFLGNILGQYVLTDQSRMDE